MVCENTVMVYITVCYELYSSPSVPPFIEAASPQMEISINESAILVCLLTAFPMPNITWLKNNQEFVPDSECVNIFEFRVDFHDSDRGSGSGSSYTSSASELIVDLLRL